MENKEDEQSTATMRSKLSFSSTTSILSAEEQLEGDGPLTPTDKMEDDVEDDEDDDDLSALNSILQAGSPGSLSDEEEEEEADDLPTEHDSASSLSSVPDDFPLSPEIPPTTTTDELETSSKKRRKEDDNEQRPLKKVKSEQEEQESIIEQEEEEPEPSKKRRVPRTPLDIPETPRTTRRKSRQEEEIMKEQQQKQTESPKPEEIPVENTIETKEEEELEAEPDHEAQDNNQDYQQRHKEALDALTHIEIEFARLRDKMYQEKMSELNEEAIMIANGTHPELVSLMAEIEEKKGKRVHSAEAWRRHQHANFKQQFEGFEYQANIHFISQKNALRRTLLDSINGRKWSIEDERTKLSDPSKGTSELLNGREIVLRKKETKEETNELQDIKEILGFPMAPNPSGLSVQDVDDDLKLLGL